MKGDDTKICGKKATWGIFVVVAFVVLFGMIAMQTASASNAIITYNDCSSPNMTFNGTWSVFEVARYSGTAGDTCNLSYTGYGAIIYITAVPSGGHFDVYIDNIFEGSYTTDSAYWTTQVYDTIPEYYMPVPVSYDTYGNHVLSIRVKGDNSVFIDGISSVNARGTPTSGTLNGFGDSISEGSAASPSTNSYLYLFGDYVNATTINNNGISSSVLCGNGTYHGSICQYGGKIFPLIIDETPEYLLIGGWTNDMRWGVDPVTFRMYYNYTLNTLKAALDTRNMTIICMSITYITDANLSLYPPSNVGNNTFLRAYNAVIKDEAEKAGFVYSDVYTAMGQNPDLISADGIHPNNAGHLAIAQQLYSDYLNSTVKPTPMPTPAPATNPMGGVMDTETVILLSALALFLVLIVVIPVGLIISLVLTGELNILLVGVAGMAIGVVSIVIVLMSYIAGNISQIFK